MPGVYAPCSDDSTNSNDSFSEDSLYREAEEKTTPQIPSRSKFRARRRRRGNIPIAKSPSDLDQNFSQNFVQIEKPKSPRKQCPRTKIPRKNGEQKTDSGRKSAETENSTKSQIPKIQNAKSENKGRLSLDLKYDQSEETNVCISSSRNTGNSTKFKECGIINTEGVILDIGNDVSSLDGNYCDASDTFESTIVTRLLRKKSGISQSVPLARCRTEKQVGVCNKNRNSLNEKNLRSWRWATKKKNVPQDKPVNPSNSRDAIQHGVKRNFSRNSKSKGITKADGKVTRIDVYMPRFEKYIEQENPQEGLPIRKADRSILPTPEVGLKKSLDQKKSSDVINTEITSFVGNDLRTSLKYLRQKVDALKAKSSRRKWSIDPRTPPMLASKDADTSPESQTDVTKNAGENIKNTGVGKNKTLVSSKVINKCKRRPGTKVEFVKVTSGFTERSSTQKGYAKESHRSPVSSCLSDSFSPITAVQKAGETNIVPDSDFLRGSSTNDSLSSSHPKSADANRLRCTRAGSGKSYKQIYEEEKVYRALLEKRKKTWKIADPFAENRQGPVKLWEMSPTRGGGSRNAIAHEEISNETWLERCHYMQQVKSQKTEATVRINQKSSSSLVSPSSSPKDSSKTQLKVKSNIPRLPPINERKVVQKTQLQKYRPSHKNEEVKRRTRNRESSTSSKQ